MPPPAAAQPAGAAGRQAAALLAQGRFAEALDVASRALATLDPDADAVTRTTLLLQQGRAFLQLGAYPDAIDVLTGAQALAAGAGAPALALEARLAAGSACLLSGREAQGRTLLAGAAAEARRLGRPDLAAGAHGDLANLLAASGQPAEALAGFEAALAEAREAGAPQMRARIALNLARALLDAGRGGEARAPLAEALEVLQRLPASHASAYGLVAAARLQTRLPPAPGGDDPRRVAAETLRSAATLAADIGDPRALSWALGYLGGIYESTGQRDDALQLTRRAAHAASQADLPEALYRWQWQTGRLLRAAGRMDDALRAYRRAVATLQSVRPDLSAGYASRHASFRAQVGPVYLELADLLLQRAAATGDGQRREARLRDARETLELLKGAELADYFQDDCVAALRSRTAGIDRIAPHTAAVYPVILPDRLEILVTLPGGMRRFVTPVGGEELTRTLHALRAGLENRITNGYLPHAQRVYDWLIRPLESELRGQAVDTLVLVPDGALRSVPLAALHDGHRFLIEKYAVATTPGLTLTDPRPIERTDVRVLLNGLTESVQGFPPLPYVESELQGIEAVFGGTVLEDEVFTVPAVEEALADVPYSVVHIASHGQFTSDARDTFLLTYDGRLAIDDLQQFMAMTTLRTRPVELLALSACQTATGDDRAALGLAGVAVKAGARSALATLWFINDQASSLLVPEFYRQLSDPALSKAEALQRAQLALMKDRRYRHPAYWSPFLLIGNWL